MGFEISRINGYSQAATLVGFGPQCISAALLLANQKKKEVRKNDRQDNIRWNRYRKAKLRRLRYGQRRQRFETYKIQEHARDRRQISQDPAVKVWQMQRRVRVNIKNSGYAETPILQQTAGLYAQTIN